MTNGNDLKLAIIIQMCRFWKIVVFLFGCYNSIVRKIDQASQQKRLIGIYKNINTGHIHY